MELLSISQVSKDYGVTTRMLRYYEQIGLLESNRKEDYAYRVYNEAAIKQLQQIIILRKLQIPVKQIKEILNNQNAVEVVEIFKQNISELDERITALSVVKSVLSRFVDEMQEKADVHLKLDLLNDKTMLAAVNALSFSENKIKEKVSMDELNKANEVLYKLADRDVRIVYLPPSAVCSWHAIGLDEQGREPWDQEDVLDEFEKELAKVKPDFRHYGFNHFVNNVQGYERWVTIPDDMDVPAPFTKKHFPGGLYAAAKLPVHPFEEGWGLLEHWVTNNDKYEPNGHPYNGGLEEHNTATGIITGAEMYIDLLFPIKLRTGEREVLPYGYFEDSEEKCGFKATLIEKPGFSMVGHLCKGYDIVKITKELSGDGRLSRMKSALNPDAPLLVYFNTSGTAVGFDKGDLTDGEYIKTEKIKFERNINAKIWICFEADMELMKDFTFDKLNPHNLVGKFGYKFDGSDGFFFVYPCGELEATEENKGKPFYCWMPVRPKEKK